MFETVYKNVLFVCWQCAVNDGTAQSNIQNISK